MHSLRTALVLVSLLASAALSSPTPQTRPQKRSFTHHVRKSVNTSGSSSGAAAVAKAFRKFGIQLDGVPAVSNAAGQTGQVAAAPVVDGAAYMESVNIGGQMLNMEFDTGSSDLWVFSNLLSPQVKGQHTVFDAQSSTTFQPLQGATFSISYGDGSGAAGTVGTDTVNIGGATATKQAVELATAVSSEFIRDTANDGLVGLAFSQLNTVQPQQQTTFFETIMPQLAMPVFSVDLRNDSTGTYQFGGIDNTKFTGQLNTVPLQPGGFWQVASPTFTVGNTVVENQGGSPAIADTGTSLVLVDPQVAAAYYSQVPGAKSNPQAGGYTYPCNTQLPAFGVSFGNDYTAMIPGDMITFSKVTQSTCFGGIQSNGGAKIQIYGDVMFRTQYVVFDGGNKQLHIAPKNMGARMTEAANAGQGFIGNARNPSV